MGHLLLAHTYPRSSLAALLADQHCKPAVFFLPRVCSTLPTSQGSGRGGEASPNMAKETNGRTSSLLALLRMKLSHSDHEHHAAPCNSESWATRSATAKAKPQRVLHHHSISSLGAKGSSKRCPASQTGCLLQEARAMPLVECTPSSAPAPGTDVPSLWQVSNTRHRFCFSSPD